jgi:DNA-binding transcriptional ArsR family regulator
MTNLKYFITSKAKRNVLHLFMLDPGKPHYTREVARLTGEPLNAVRRELGHLEKAGLLSSRAQGNLKYYEVVKGFPLLAQWRKIILESDTTPPPLTVVATPSPVIAGEAKQSPQPKHSVAIIEPLKHVPLEDGDKPIIPGARVIPNHEPITTPAVIELPSPAVVTDTTAGQSPEQKQGTILNLKSVVNHLGDQLKDLDSISLALIHGEAARSDRIPTNGIDLLVIGDINRDTLLALIADFEDKAGVNVKLTSMTRSDFDYRNAQGDSLVRKIWGEKKMVVKGRQ